MEPAAPWHLVLGYKKYREQLHDIEQHLLVNKKLPPLVNLTDKNKHTSNTLVLLIGESTNSQRMSLYGYKRNTTPQLDALKDELLVFENVYAARPYTIEALQQVLIFADAKSPNVYLTKPTLINLMKQAGYTNYGSADLIYSWADLAGISFNEFDPGRSIVNELFQKNPIWIGNPDKPEFMRDLQKNPFPDYFINNKSNFLVKKGNKSAQFNEKI